jgi:zinc protease
MRRSAGIVLSLCLLPVIAFAAPPIQSWTTENGARVLFIETHELPIVDIQVVFDAAGSRDGERPGIARLTNALLAEGAGGLSADAIAEGFAELGAQFSNDSLRDMATVSLRSLSDPSQLDPAVELMATVLARPDFTAEALERLRRQMLAGLDRLEQSPAQLAQRAFYRALYADHPYALPPGGTRESLGSLGLDEVRGHHARYYVARNAVVAMVGALDRRRAEAVAARVLAGLPAGEPAPALPAVTRAGEGSARVTVSHPSSQTHLLMGQPGMSRLDPDYFALYVGNHAFGGNALVSLLGKEVREKRGLSYSVYSAFIPMRSEGPFLVNLQTRNEQAEEALAVTRETLRRFLEQGPTEAELVAAKQNITGGFPLDIASNQKLVGYLSSIGFYGLPLDYLETFTDRIDSVTREAVHDAFKRRLDTNAMRVVLVGEPGAPQSPEPAQPRDGVAARATPGVPGP